MDEIVERAIAKWPNVPAVFGWLSLDRRGNWAIKGERIQNRVITDFIGRNYACDGDGRWFFQNGPQKVYVALGYAPWVLRTQPGPRGIELVTHTASAVFSPRAAWVDELGDLLVEFEGGLGVVHDQDLTMLLPCLCDARGQPLPDAAVEAFVAGTPSPGAPRLKLASGSIPVGMIRHDEVAGRFRFDPDPRPAPGEPEC